MTPVEAHLADGPLSGYIIRRFCKQASVRPAALKIVTMRPYAAVRGYHTVQYSCRDEIQFAKRATS